MLSEAKMTRLFKQQTNVAQDVLECLDLANDRSSGYVAHSLQNRGKNISLRTVEGCLAHLVRVGLAKEPQPGVFLKAPYKPGMRKAENRSSSAASNAEPQPVERMTISSELLTPPENKPAVVIPQMQVVQPVDKKTFPTVFDRLAGVAKNLRGLANEIEDITLQAQDELDSLGKKGEKLSKLKALLKEIGDE